MYTVEGNGLIFENGRRKQFDAQIAETLDFEDALIVRLATDPFYCNENVFAFTYAGEQLWRIPSRPQVQGNSPYVGLWRKDTNFIEAYNWNGFSMVLHPRLGTVLHEGVSITGTMSPRRTPSRRVWI